MSAIEIGSRLVSLCNDGKAEEAVEQLYDPGIVSIEGQGSDEMPARMEGIEAIRRKNQWWYANHEVHATTATGPFCGHRDDQFVVQFDLDVTPKASGERTRMREVGLYTTAGGKIVQEEFLYLMG
ncbi:MAG: SnoaL-like domain-containing protein [Myxococcota bacterium]